ncbi:glutamyl-tRNA reductase [Halorubrum lacusprofundi]|jgi:glutamyl-tRNA reductase|uniref:glutamyl-tRNA reductase n=1 Tax=Halorubrum lacusprofundi TaxID=2247 RepID=UPI000B5AA0F9|nr:glutamyl-tRNA reductase [Halorubrum lacusprofundi]MCG1008382.1 glutamyl-tRNA reductase [Halorubrum lacusprofundi]
MTPNRLDTEQNLNYRDDAIDTETDADSVRRRLQRRSARIERREVEEAISKLEAHGDLTDEQRRTVRMLGSDLTRKLMVAPESRLEQSSRDRPKSVRAVARLFDIPLESRSDADSDQL